METVPVVPPALPPVVGLSLEAPQRQHRAKVGFRVILAIPHLLYAGILSVVLEFAVVIGWFCALVLGRLPDGIAEFTARVLRYLARVYGYAYFLLTDRYPPFALEPDAPYAVELELPARGRLNRAAVLFRIVLLVPALILSTIVGYGLLVPLIVIWLLVILSGRMPRTPFEALAAVLRYQLRVFAFATMLTSEYPRGLFGDKAVPVAELAVPAEDEPILPPPTMEEPRITRLVLSKPARRLVILFIVLGSMTMVGVGVVAAVAASNNNKAYDAYVEADQEAGTASFAYAREVQGCAINGGLPCLHRADLRLATAIDRFRDRLESISFPANALGAADALDRDTGQMADVLRRLASIDDGPTYQREVVNLQQVAQRVGQDEANLASLLRRV